MTRTQTLIVTTVLAAAVPFATAMAQGSKSACGPESWSSAKMTYTRTPCNAGDATAQAGGPTAYGAGSSSSMTKAEMKQSAPSGYPHPGGFAHQGYAPMQSQAVMAGSEPPSMMSGQSCGPSNAVAITDEYGRKYNCRGDRIRR